MLVVLSFFSGYLFLLGYPLTRAVRSRSDPFAYVGLSMAAGLLLQFCGILAGLALPHVLVLGAAVALWSIWLLAVDRRARSRPRIPPTRGTAVTVVLIATVLLVHYLQIFAEPLYRWDARSIWFFHARMIWLAQGLGSGWDHPSLAFSHPDYPKLVPSLAAQVAYLAGHWNEYAPKGGLFLMLVPAVLLLFGCRTIRGSFVLMVVLLFVSQYAGLSNGYMDGYLVLYAALALLLFGRLLSSHNRADFYAGTCALGIVAALKNEGTLFACCTIAALVMVIGPRQLARAAARSRTEPRLLLIPCLAILPVLLWTLRKAAWGVRNDMTGDVAGAVAHVASRLSDGASPQYVFEYPDGARERRLGRWRCSRAADRVRIGEALHDSSRHTAGDGDGQLLLCGTVLCVFEHAAWSRLSPLDLRGPHDGRRPHRALCRPCTSRCPISKLPRQRHCRWLPAKDLRARAADLQVMRSASLTRSGALSRFQGTSRLLKRCAKTGEPVNR